MSVESYSPIVAGSPADEILQLRQDVHPQPEGLGLRTGNKAEFTFIAPLLTGGAEIFKQRVGKAQAEAAYWEGKLGTVHDLRICLFGDEKYVLFAATYSDEFKPYVLDVIKFATPWLDYLFLGAVDGYPGLQAPEALDFITKYQVQASLWYASNADLTPHDIAKAQKITAAFDQLLDLAQE